MALRERRLVFPDWIRTRNGAQDGAKPSSGAGIVPRITFPRIPPGDIAHLQVPTLPAIEIRFDKWIYPQRSTTRATPSGDETSIMHDQASVSAFGEGLAASSRCPC